MKLAVMALFDAYNWEQKIYSYKGEDEQSLLKQAKQEPELSYLKEELEDISSFDELKERIEDDADQYAEIKIFDI